MIYQKLNEKFDSFTLLTWKSENSEIPRRTKEWEVYERRYLMGETLLVAMTSKNGRTFLLRCSKSLNFLLAKTCLEAIIEVIGSRWNSNCILNDLIIASPRLDPKPLRMQVFQNYLLF